MKIIYLVRHSAPDRTLKLPNQLVPLTARGHQLAEDFFAKQEMHGVKKVYASPYLRAIETARHTGQRVAIDERLRERAAGHAVAEMGDCWLRQYEDHDFKCHDGESFNEVKLRMTSCIDDILASMQEGERAILVTHAAAMCAYLLNHCAVRVVDRANKMREFLWNERIIYAGCLPTPSGFRLVIDCGEVVDISFMME